MEGGQSSYTLPLVYRSQIARTYGGFRAFGAKLTGDYKWFDYNVGIYDSSRYFYDMFKGAEFTGWVNFKPLANLDEEKYGLKPSHAYALFVILVLNILWLIVF